MIESDLQASDFAKSITHCNRNEDTLILDAVHPDHEEHCDSDNFRLMLESGNSDEMDGGAAQADGSYNSELDSVETESLESSRNTTEDTYRLNKKVYLSEGIKIAQRENQAVMIWKMVVISAMVLITIGVSIAVFVYVDSKEQENFEDSFEEDSYKILSDLGMGIVQRFAQLDGLAVDMLAYADVSQSSWPFVTIPNYAIRASKARRSSGAVAIETFYILEGDDDSESNSTRKAWEFYSKFHGKNWIQQTLTVQALDDSYFGEDTPDNWGGVEHTGIWYGDAAVPLVDSGPYVPSWQAYPIALPSEATYNWNAVMDPLLGPGLHRAIQYKEAVLTQALNIAGDMDDPMVKSAADSTAKWASRLANHGADPKEPLLRFLYPVLDSALSVQEDNREASVIAVAASSFYFGTLLSDILSSGQNGLVVVIDTMGCGQTFSYVLNGANATYLGQGDLHDPSFTSYGLSANLSELRDIMIQGGWDQSYGGLPVATTYCMYNVTIYPSEAMEQKYRSSDPIIFTYSVIVIFLITSLCFLGYDKLVADRQQKVMKSAQKSNAIISSLFPSNIRDRLFVEDGESGEDALVFQPTKARLKNYLQDADGSNNQQNREGGARPIADLFTDCTVMFADIANFTAWSSVREPGQVFTLLETLYGAFDQIAARRGVFKVETIGDSYVAVAGLPEPRKDHAVVMVKFSRDCRQQCVDTCSQLEVTLGPETGDLRMRFGLHSGPVTAGVLRGEKSRFQLFGDTVNTAARMESHGLTGRIQISQATADLLIEAGKDHWLTSREDKVEAKGKGLLQTYWVDPGGKNKKYSQTLLDHIDTKTERLVNWNVVVLSHMLLQLINHKEAHRPVKRTSSNKPSVQWSKPLDRRVLGEVKEIIELPEFSAAYSQKCVVDDLDNNVKQQLHDYVTQIALTYRDNHFHNFEHASHVTMSVAKLLSRITAPDQVCDDDARDSRILASTMHDFTFGITSDPLTSFACVFAALIHDADHPGVPNSQLVKEETEQAKLYQGKSVAEQNSVNIAWDLLIEPRFTNLRDAICETKEEAIRFRQLVVNSVMATDIMDKDLKKLREDRWKKAFTDVAESEVEVHLRNAMNRKATIVIEHLIQASDVAHTMQHWHIYQKWNQRLFKEMYKAFKEGRAEKDPTTFWYEGELGFFDFYIIPLAKKLSDCGVFGVSSDEYLNYALMNRSEWEKKGQWIVEEMLDQMAREASTYAPPLRDNSQSTETTKDSSQDG